MNSTLSAITKKGMDQFQEQHADFFALLSEPPNKVFERLGAAIVLDTALQEKFKEYGSVENICCPDPNFRKSRQQMFIALLHQSLAQKLIKFCHRLATSSLPYSRPGRVGTVQPSWKCCPGQNHFRFQAPASKDGRRASKIRSAR